MTNNVTTPHQQYHYIYKITCLCGSFRGKYYIGKHSTIDINDNYVGSGRLIIKYMKKYGKKEGETYIKEYIEFNPTYSQNTLREKEIIGNIYMTDPYCLNLRNGGDGMAPGVLAGNKNPRYGKKISKETRQRLRDSHKGLPSSRKGIPLSEETKRKLSIAMTGRPGPNKGKKASSSTIQKLRTSHLGKRRSRESVLKSIENNSLRRRVNQYDLNGNFIREWYSVSEAQKSINNNGSIGECCAGKRKTCGGYIWRYANECLPCVLSKI